MNELTYDELIQIHERTLVEHGGLPGVKDRGFLLSALAQPDMSFGGEDLYSSIPEKAAALGFSLVKNHAFNDGNKRVSFLAMAVFLYKNGYLLEIPEEEVIRFMLDLAASQIEREELVIWIEDHVEPLGATASTEIIEQGESTGPLLALLSEAAQRIADEKPRAWEHRLFAQVLRDELAQHAALRTQHREGGPVFPRIPVAKSDFLRFISEPARREADLVQRAVELHQFLANAAFGADGTRRDEFFMVSLARELAGLYKEFLDWSLWWRQLLVPDPFMFQPFIREASIHAEGYLQSVESLPDRLDTQLDRFMDAPYDQPKRVEISVDMTPLNEQGIADELAKLERRLLRGM